MHHPANNEETTRPETDAAPDADLGRMWWLDEAALDAQIDRELHRIAAKIEYLERRDGIR
jgi:hypothetical protein